MPLTLIAPNLWRSARVMLNELFFRITGTTPAHLNALKRRERKDLQDWLAALEAMVRKILLIEAAALGPPAPRRHGSTAPKHASENAGGTGAAAKRAPTFALLPAETRERQHPARIRMLGAPTSLAELLRTKARAQRISALRDAPTRAPYASLANRISALARVIANPNAAIRALAERLRKSRDTGFKIIAARTPTPETFHGDAKLAADCGAINAVTHLLDSS